MALLDGGIAQLGEHLLCKQGVNGSIPFISTTHFFLKEKVGKKNFALARFRSAVVELRCRLQGSSLNPFPKGKKA